VCNHETSILKSSIRLRPMKLAVVSNLDTGMMEIIERIKEQAMDLKVGMELAPVNRIIDIPMAVLKASLNVI